MKKIEFKRVCLISPDGIRMDFTQEFFPTLSDTVILDFFHEIGKTVWIGHNLYKMQWDNGCLRHYRYEVYKVTQYEKSWYNLLFDAIRNF